MPGRAISRSILNVWLLAVALAAGGRLRGADGSTDLLQAGQQAVLRGDHGAAIGHLEKAVVQAPRDPEAQHWLGNAYAWAAAGAEWCDKPALGRKCLAAYRRALELDPENLPARLSLMNFYRHVPRVFGGGLARARAEAAEIGRRDAVLGRYAEAVLHAHEKEYATALAALDRVRRERPGFYAAHALFGRIALESGLRREDGVAALTRCLELPPTIHDETHAAVEQWRANLTARTARPEVVAQRR